MILAERRRRGQMAPLSAGQLVRRIREEAQLTPGQLCKKIAMNVGQLSDIERGIQHLSLRRARQMAIVFDHPFDEIVAKMLQDKLDEAGFVGLHVEVYVNKAAREPER